MAGKRIPSMTGRAADQQTFIGHAMTDPSPLAHERPLPWLSRATSSRIDRILEATTGKRVSVPYLDAAAEDHQLTLRERLGLKIAAQMSGRLK